MTPQTLAALLRKLGACSEAREWTKGKSLAESWEHCERGDWMLWLCAKMIGKDGWPSHQEVVLAACACAEMALKFVRSGEDRPRLAIETARRWAAGSATLDEVRTAAYAAAYAAYAYAAAYAAAAYAAYAYAADAYAANAADAYAANAANAASSARGASLKVSADLIRTHVRLKVLA